MTQREPSASKYDKPDGRHFILVDRRPMPANLMTWARWFEATHGTPQQVVARDEIDDVTITTAFRSLPAIEYGNPTLLFESVISGGRWHGGMRLYASWAEAEAGHHLLCEKVRARATGAAVASNALLASINQRSPSPDR